jgi:hypothetical protein
MEGDGRHTRASYIEDDCKINAGIEKKEEILKKLDEMEYMLHDDHNDDHMPPHLRLKESIKELEGIPGGSTPSQYQLPDNATDLQDLIEYRQMNFAMGNIFKACYRSGNCSHSDLLRDINKVLWFAEREKKRLEKSLQKTL